MMQRKWRKREAAKASRAERFAAPAELWTTTDGRRLGADGNPVGKPVDLSAGREMYDWPGRGTKPEPE